MWVVSRGAGIAPLGVGREYPVTVSVGEGLANSRLVTVFLALVGLSCLPWTAGCLGRGEPERPRFSPMDFQGTTPPESSLSQALMTDPASGSAPRQRPLDASRFAGSSGGLSVPPAREAEVVGPQDTPDPARPVVLLLDVKVGEVNNKAIFASDFLYPIASRLRALVTEEFALPGGGVGTRRRPLAQWQAQAVPIIDEQLRTFITNELVIAEGLAQSTPMQRAGLRNFLGLVRTDLAQRGGGSITRAVRNLESGETLAQYLERVRNTQLINQFADSIRRGIVVTRSDVERAYLQKYGNNRKPSKATFRWIRVPLRDEDGAARIAERLARGEPFSEVASDEANRSRRSDGGLWPAVDFTGEFSQASILPNDPELEAALRKLTPGEWSGPIEDDRDRHWLFLEGIEIGYRTWAEAQSELREELYVRRFNEAFEREMMRLYMQAGLEDISAMRAELVDVATAWFYPAR